MFPSKGCKTIKTGISPAGLAQRCTRAALSRQHLFMQHCFKGPRGLLARQPRKHGAASRCCVPVPCSEGPVPRCPWCSWGTRRQMCCSVPACQGGCGNLAWVPQGAGQCYLSTEYLGLRRFALVVSWIIWSVLSWYEKQSMLGRGRYVSHFPREGKDS